MGSSADLLKTPYLMITMVKNDHGSISVVDTNCWMQSPSISIHLYMFISFYSITL